jgi:hypothetical protein
MRQYLSFSSIRIVVAHFAAAVWLASSEIAFGSEPALLLKNQTNPRYFSDGTKSVYLTGQHIPTNFNDWEGSPIIDFAAFTDNMAAKNQNFLRLWALDAPHAYHLDGTVGAIAPVPFVRTGPGLAADGLPKFNLSQLNQGYFDRLRSRVMEAGTKNIYVSVMLTNGIFVENVNNFSYSFYNSSNNVNSGLSSLTNSTQYTLSNTAWVSYMDAYVDKVVDTLADLNNVLYEVSNEAQANTSAWQDHVINRIHQREAGKPKQHFVGKTAFGYSASDSAINADLLAGNADWVSLAGRTAPTYTTAIANAPATKVSILDTDHIWGFTIPAAERVPWVWKSFTRGHNPIYITPLTGYPGGFHHYPEIENALGHAKALADRTALSYLFPSNNSASTGYCLASPNIEYVVYQPNNSSFTVTLPARKFDYEWINPHTGVTIKQGTFSATAGNQTFNLPAGLSSAVLYLKLSGPRITAMALNGQQMSLEAQGDPHTTYRLETSTDITGSFDTTSSTTSDASGAFSHDHTSEETAQFYRVVFP